MSLEVAKQHHVIWTGSLGYLLRPWRLSYVELYRSVFCVAKLVYSLHDFLISRPDLILALGDNFTFQWRHVFE